MTIINSEKTAIKRKKQSTPATNNLNYLINGDVLDFGCGHGADVEFYQSNGFDSVGYDPHHRNVIPDAYFENVTCTYVLNAINFLERVECIEDAIQFLKTGGRLIITVRSDVEKNAKSKSWKKHLDGFWSNEKRGMFQADIPDHQIIRTVEKFMFSKLISTKKNSSFKTFVFEKCF